MIALSPLAQAGLDQADFGADTLRLSERPDVTAVRVHSLLDLPTEVPALDAWPAGTGDCLGGDPAVLCLRPREWLCLSESLGPSDMCARFLAEIDNATTTANNVSDSLAVFRAAGAAAPWLLAKLSGLDVLGDAAGKPRCARTRMGDAAVVVHWRTGRAEDFDLLVDRSLARYLWERLIDCAPHAEQLASTGWPLGAGGGR